MDFSDLGAVPVKGKGIDFSDLGDTAPASGSSDTLGNAFQDVVDIGSGLYQGAKTIAKLPQQMPSDIYNTAQQMGQGKPFGGTPLGLQADQLGSMVVNALPHPDPNTGGWNGGAIFNRGKEIVMHPAQSFQEHPIKTALDIASVVAPIAGKLAPMGLAEDASLADKVGKASKVGELAQDAAMNTIGASKRFINNSAKELTMRKTAQVLLDEGIIKPTSTAKSLAEDTARLAETSGKEIGDHLTKMGADGDFILPQQLKVEVQALRPIQESTGKILRGGKYNVINNKIDDALETIDAHGNDPISWKEANELKGTFQEAANWQSNKDATVLDRIIAGKVRETLDNSLEKRASELGDSAGHQNFLEAKEKYSAALNAQDPLYNRISSELGNDRVGLTDYVLAAGAITRGDIGTALALLGGKKALRTFGPSTMASGLNKLNKVNPASLGLIPGAINTGSSLGLTTSPDNSGNQ